MHAMRGKTDMTILRKSNDAPIKPGDLVFTRRGMRCLVRQLDPLLCISKDNRVVRGSLHEFGCYIKGQSPHNSVTPFKLRSFWED